MEQFDSKYFMGQGSCYLGSRDAAGKPINLIYAGDLEQASLQPNITKVQVREHRTGQRRVAAAGLTGVAYQLSVGFKSMKPEHAAVWMQGGLAVKPGTTVTDESHVASAGGFIPLLHAKVSAVTVTNVGATVTYVADTDYIVHADSGLIEVLSAGSIADASTVLIDYTYAAQSHISVDPSNIYRYLVFAGVNTLDNDKQTRVEVYKLQLDPSVMDLIQDDREGVATAAGEVLHDDLRPAGDQLFKWIVE